MFVSASSSSTNLSLAGVCGTFRWWSAPSACAWELEVALDLHTCGKRWTRNSSPNSGKHAPFSSRIQTRNEQVADHTDRLRTRRPAARDRTQDARVRRTHL